MKPVRIGCSGWMYDDWRGGLYPERLAKRRWLEAYASAFDTVEVNSTFYRLARREAVAGWVQQTPAGFLFAVKASRYLTHIKRLVDMRDGIARFYEPLEPMQQAGRLGPVLWQLPENFHRDDQRLEGWLGLLAGGKHTIEFRHPSWFAPEVFDALRAARRRVGDRRSSRAAVPDVRSDGHVEVRPFPLRLAGPRRQLLGGRDRYVGAADRAVAPARAGVRVLQQRLARVRAGEREAAASPARPLAAGPLDRRQVDRPAEALGELVLVEVLAVALIFALGG